MTVTILRILAIDDREEMLYALRDALEEAGHRVLTASTGSLGLALAEQDNPDVILLDISMPEMDGLQVLQVLKQSPDTDRIPVVLLTAGQDTELMKRGFELGASDYLRKPFNVHELQARVRHLARLKEALDEVRHLQELNRLKEDFLSILSHELRTPLTAVIGFTQLLLSGAAGPLNAAQAQFNEIILQRAGDLQHLIEELLEFNLIKAGQRRITPRSVPLHTLVDTTVERLSISLKQKDLHLDVRLPDPGLMAVVDPEALQRVLAILLDNAIKFTPEGGILTLEVKVTPKRLIVKVSDTGIGISTDRLPVIFDSFRQLEGHRTRRYEGLGLGLSIAKHLVELHGGRIWAESREGHGSAFTVSLPLSGSGKANGTVTLNDSPDSGCLDRCHQ